MNTAIRHNETDDVTQTNKALWVAKTFGGKKGKTREKKSQNGKKRIESDIINLRSDIIRLERERRGETGRKGKRKIMELNAKYRLDKKVIEELKQRLISKKMKFKRY